MNKNNKSQIPTAAAARGSEPSSSDSSRYVKRAHRNHLLCRTSEYKPPGSTQVGLTKENQPSKVVWELDYGLTKTQFESLSARFPGVAFVQVGMDAHDHPIAHTSYRIVWENVMKQLQPGWLCADISGNPAHNEKYNKRQQGRANPIVIDTFCKVVSPKDSVRAKTRWGPASVDGKVRWEEMTLYDMYRNEENIKRFSRYDCFLMNHTLYYYTKAEITKLVNMNKNAVLIATIHKLPGQSGDINCGEQHYEKDLLTGRVTQVNVETGEDYQHPDPAGWFKHFSYADEHGAIAWTVNKGCDDTYRVTITSTEPYLVPEQCWLDGRIVLRNDKEEVVQVDPVRFEDPPPAYPVEVVTIRTRDFLPNSFIDKSMDIPITHPDLYETLKKFMINKPRTHATLKDLTSKAHREAGNNVLYGAGKVKIKIDSDNLTKHILLAWRHGAYLESSLFEIAVGDGAIGSVNRNLAGKTLSIGGSNYVKQFTRYALAISSVARSKDPVHQVLAQFDELL